MWHELLNKYGRSKSLDLVIESLGRPIAVSHFHPKMLNRMQSYVLRGITKIETATSVIGCNISDF